MTIVYHLSLYTLTGAYESGVSKQIRRRYMDDTFLPLSNKVTLIFPGNFLHV